VALQKDADKVAAEILENPEGVPEILRRCIASVWTEPKLRGGTLREKFVGAVAISLNSLRNANDPRMVNQGRSQGPWGSLTSYGHIRNHRKLTDGTNTEKLQRFRRIVRMVKAEEKQGQQRSTMPGSRQ